LVFEELFNFGLFKDWLAVFWTPNKVIVDVVAG